MCFGMAMMNNRGGSMVSKNEEIYELARFIGEYNMQKGSIDERYLPYVSEVAAAIYDAGYRKNVNCGNWTIKNSVPHCSECNWHPTKEMLQNTEAGEFEYDYCPYCGSIMKKSGVMKCV